MAANAPQRLRVDGLTDPVGLGNLRPLLSWWPQDERDAEVPTACELQVASSLARLAQGDGNLWQSGRMQAAASHSVRYAGREPAAGERLFWRVRTVDSDGAVSPWSDPASFEVGLSKPEHWHAPWITTGEAGGRHQALPAALVSKGVELQRPITEARLTVACLGDCQVRINGSQLEGLSGAAPWTDFRYTACYRTLDVTELLSAGLNRLDVLLADGRYCGPLAGLRERYGTSPALRLQLELRYPGGERDWVVSDAGWTWQHGPVTTTADGEAIDLRRAGLSPVDEGRSVIVLPAASTSDVEMRAAPGPSPTVQQRLPAVSQRRRDDGLLFDFGERVTGRACLQVAADALRSGRPVDFSYFDHLDAPPVGRDCFTLAETDEAWEELVSVFSRHRFRYLQVNGLASTEVLEASAHTVGLPQRNDQELLFDAPVLSALVESAERTLFDATQSVVETPDGFGDLAAIALGARGMLATGDALDALRGVQRNLLDVVSEPPFPGRYAPAIPELGDLGEDCPLASDALVILPWTLYRCCADLDSLRLGFPAMKRFISALEARYPGGVRSATRLPPALATDGSRDLAPTALYFYSVSLAARTAAVLGDSEAFNRFEGLLKRIKRAFLEQYVTPAGRLIDSSLEACLITLHVGVLDGDARDRVRAELLAQLKRRRQSDGDRVLASPLVCAWLLPVLTAFDRLDVAYALVLDERVRDPLANRDDDVGDAPMIDSLWQIGLMDWVVSCVAGIDLDPDIRRRHAGYSRARLRPRPPLGINGLGGPPVTRVEASLATVSGRYELGWSLTDDSFEVRALVPPGCTAVLIMPDGAEHALSSGRHVRTLSLADSADALPIVTELPDQDIA